MARRSSRMTSSRAKLIGELQDASRVHSTAAVLLHAAIAARFGLGATDIKALELLSRMGPLTPGRLAAETGLSASSVTSLVDRLESRGFSHRTRDPEDRRRVIVELDPGRTRRIFSQFGALKASAEELWAPYSTNQLEVILDFLRRSAALLTSSRDGIRG